MRAASGGDDVTDRQGSAHRGADGADLVGLVGFEAAQRGSVFIGIDSDGADAKFVGGPKRPDGDLAAIGNEHFGNHLYPYLRLFRSALTSRSRTGPQSAEKPR